MKPSQLLAVIFLVLLCGCDFRAQTSAMVVQSGPSVAAPHAPVLVSVEGGNAVGKSANVTEELITNDEFAEAVSGSLRNSHLFQSVGDSNAPLRLQLTILDLSEPGGGFAAPVSLKVDWLLVRVSNQQVLWHEEIRTEYRGTMADSMMQATRTRIATEKAAQENIGAALPKIAALNF